MLKKKSFFYVSFFLMFLWSSRRIVNKLHFSFKYSALFFSVNFLLHNIIFFSNSDSLYIENLYSRSELVKPEREVVAATPENQLFEFQHKFPRQDDTPDLVYQLYAIAEGRSLIPEQGSYRLLEKSPQVRLARYEITMPLKGNYTAIRGFISQALQELPTLSLDALRLSRASANDPMLEAELRMTLYLGPQ